MNIYEKLQIIQQKLEAPKGQFHKYGNYNYRKAEDILASVKSLLNETKTVLILNDEIIEVNGRFYVRATAGLYNCEDLEQSIKSVAYAREPEKKSLMDESQTTGSASSYARKYALSGLFAIDDEKDPDDPEEQSDQKQQQSNQKQQTKNQAQKQQQAQNQSKQKQSQAQNQQNQQKQYQAPQTPQQQNIDKNFQGLLDEVTKLAKLKQNSPKFQETYNAFLKGTGKNNLAEFSEAQLIGLRGALQKL